MFAKPMFSMLVWSYCETGQLSFASNGHEAAMIASMASCAALRNSATALLQPVYATDRVQLGLRLCACCQMHPRFAESTAQLCAEGEIANLLSGLPGGSESHGKRPETYTISYTYTL